MKRFLTLAACASVIVVAIQASSQGQDRPRGPALRDPLAAVRIGPKFSNPDLAVVEFMGAFRGTDYVLGGKVMNVGNAPYSRTFKTTGGYDGRTLQLFAIVNGGLGKGGSSKLLRTYSVRSLNAKESWSTPTMTIPAREVPGSATAHFLLKLSGSDIDTSNDWKQIIVSVVH